MNYLLTLLGFIFGSSAKRRKTEIGIVEIDNQMTLVYCGMERRLAIAFFFKLCIHVFVSMSFLNKNENFPRISYLLCT